MTSTFIRGRIKLSLFYSEYSHSHHEPSNREARQVMQACTEPFNDVEVSAALQIDLNSFYKPHMPEEVRRKPKHSLPYKISSPDGSCTSFTTPPGSSQEPTIELTHLAGPRIAVQSQR